MLRFLSVTLILMLLPACDSETTPPLRPGPFMDAKIERAISTEHRGGATFGGGTMSDTHRKLHVSSRDPAADSRLGLSILSSSPIRFEPGTYPLSPRNFEGGDNEGNTAIYLRGSDRYVAESGTLTITGVTDERVSGHFELTAVFWCNAAVDREPCYTLPHEFPPETPRIDVWGEFSAEGAGEVPLFGG